jgi:hypothetical protein
LAVKEPSPSLPLNAFFGEYSDPAYGDFVVRPLRVEAAKYDLLDGAEDFYERTQGLEIADYIPPTNSHSLVVEIKGRRFFDRSHFVLAHAGGDTWKGTLAYVFSSADQSKRVVSYTGSNSSTFAFRVQEGSVQDVAVFGVAEGGHPAEGLDFRGPSVILRRQ